LSFRKKIFYSQLLLLILFFALLFPFIEKGVKSIVHESLEESTRDLIERLKQTSSEKEMIKSLREQQFFVFFRVTLLSEGGEILYNEYLLKHLGEKYTPFYPTSHPEVLQALKRGVGYSEGYSELTAQKFAYVAVAFDFLGKRYILRTAFPFTQVEELTRNFERGFIAFSILILLIFSGLIWFIFYRFSRPIQEIIAAIKPYRAKDGESLPEIKLSKSLKAEDDFKRLADTLNSLSEKIRLQIKSLVEERNEKEAILESLGEGVIAVDAQMHVRYVNFTASKMLGIPKRHLLGKPFPSLLEEQKPPSPLIAKARSLLEACQEKETILTDSLSLADGKKLYLDLIAAPKMHGEGAIIVLQDKSSHHKVLEMGKDFVANASHELRTPITIIRGFAETLQDLPKISPEMLSDITEKIVRNCQRMDTLVKNLLTLADIENLPKTRFKPCDLLSLIDNCRHLLLSVYPEAQFSIEKKEDSLIIRADADLLELALMNLFDNAAKYSTPPAQISVQIQRLAEEVKIVISDRGIGIPASDLEHIFERFYTVDKAHSRRLGGAGLGLSIVKTIIEKHEGSISVISHLGIGTTFTLLLPVGNLKS
jgi:two-component system, OmpR family, phosphate regulon sensor histidine kinase PhoR